jgi:hypothetical protein
MPREFHDAKTGDTRGEFDVEVDRIESKFRFPSADAEESEEAQEAVVNKGKNTNADWNEKAGTILKKKAKQEVKVASDGEETVVKAKKRRRRPGKSKQAAEPAPASAAPASELEISDGDHSDGEDGGRVLSKVDRSTLPGDEVAGAEDSRNRKQVRAARAKRALKRSGSTSDLLLLCSRAQERSAKANSNRLLLLCSRARNRTSGSTNNLLLFCSRKNELAAAPTTSFFSARAKAN